MTILACVNAWIQNTLIAGIQRHTVLGVKNDLLAGITVAFAMVPEVIAFAFVAGVNPLMGLYTAIMVGLVTAIVGGRTGMVSGAAGALAVVSVSLVASHGIEYLLAAVILMGVLQVLAGVLRLGRFIRLVPYTVLLGFVNGLAVVIFWAQLKQFRLADGSWMIGEPLYTMLGLVMLTMLIVWLLPKYTKAVPAGLVAIGVVTLVAILAGLNAKSVGDMATIAGQLPPFHVPLVSLTWQTLGIITPYALILAAIGLIESLLTMSVIDEMTDTRGNTTRVCLGLGSANVATGFFGGMGGCAMIGQSMINLASGATTNLSAITMALCILAFTLFASPLIAIIPVAALVGVMFMVVIATAKWSSVSLLPKIPKEDSVVGILVAVITVVADLATAVIVGVILLALVFAWKQAKYIYTTTEMLDIYTKKYQVHGPLFFGSVYNFNKLFDYQNDPATVIIDFTYSRIADHSAVVAIDTLAKKYRKGGIHLQLVGLQPDCMALLSKATEEGWGN